jgi:hypothetical protein
MLHKVIPQFYVLDFICCGFSQWPPWFTWQRDCAMLHEVIPLFQVIVVTRC